MNKTNLIKILTILFSTKLFADLASPTPFIAKQPNGVELSILNRGNHLQGWHEHNGWTVVKNQNGWWLYAEGKDGNVLIPSNLKVGIDNPEQYPMILQKGIRPEPRVLIDNAPIPNLNSTRTDTFHVPLLLVEFPDANAIYSPEEIDMVMNQEGYTHLNNENSGSFRDFYQEISYGNFLPIAEVSDWFMASNGHDYYSYNNGYQRVRELIRTAVDDLEDAGFDWSVFDNDNDGYVDALNVIHQGPGAEEGDYSNIWSHKSSLGNLAVSYDGVIISSYNISPEIQNGNLVAIGVLAHEFGHALGLPDLYDTDYSSSGSGKLALMASGSWGTSNNSPWYPATMIGWCKEQLGWVDVVEINDDLDAVSIEQTYSSNIVYRVNHSQVEEEYWLIENRQKIGSDTLMPTPGLTIWHINDNMAEGWAVNNDEPYYGVGLEQADGMNALENGGPSNGGDVYPGDTNNREFSNSSSPNTSSLYGEPSMLRIDNISDPGEFMTFDVEYNEVILAEAFIRDGNGNAYGQGSLSIGIDNDFELNELQFDLDFAPAFVEITGVTALERTTFDTAYIEGGLVTLVNPIITPGSGDILSLQLFNNVGVETSVHVTYNMCIGYTSDGSEVGIGIQDDANYQIQGVDQYFIVQSGNGTIGGGASILVSLANTVPIALTMLEISNTPEILIPSAEPFSDVNENGEYDLGEPFTDWNQNGQWSPIIEQIGLSEDWNVDITVVGSNLIINMVNWNNPLEPNSNELFRVNYLVNDEAMINDMTTISTNAALILDAWGNSGVPHVNVDGTVTINEVLSSGNDPSQLPLEFSLDRVHPNPFNPITSISFSVPGENQDPVFIRIFNLNGGLVATLINQSVLAPGNHLIMWDASYVGSGIYFVEFIAGNTRKIQKITLLK
ncbi:MAG: M6 family metalloprotease domain-containing protein [Candidatus Neomarinimicrobiota bacterium]